MCVMTSLDVSSWLRRRAWVLPRHQVSRQKHAPRHRRVRGAVQGHADSRRQRAKHDSVERRFGGVSPAELEPILGPDQPKAELKSILGTRDASALCVSRAQLVPVLPNATTCLMWSLAYCGVDLLIMVWTARSNPEASPTTPPPPP